MNGLDQQVQQRMDAYRGNPQKLAQRYQQNQQLIDLLALQKLKSEKEAAARHMQMQMQQNPQTIAQQREQEVLGLTKNEMVQKTGKVLGHQQKKQQQNLQRVAQQGLPAAQKMMGAQKPAPTRQQPPVQMAEGGLVSLGCGGKVKRRKGMGKAKKYAEGGIVHFDNGGTVEADIEAEVKQLQKLYAAQGIPKSIAAIRREVVHNRTARARNIYNKMGRQERESTLGIRTGARGAGLPNAFDPEKILAAQQEAVAPPAGLAATDTPMAQGSLAQAPGDDATQSPGGGLMSLAADTGQNTLGGANADASIPAAQGYTSRSEETTTRSGMSPDVAALHDKLMIAAEGGNPNINVDKFNIDSIKPFMDMYGPKYQDPATAGDAAAARAKARQKSVGINTSISPEEKARLERSRIDTHTGRARKDEDYQRLSDESRRLYGLTGLTPAQFRNQKLRAALQGAGSTMGWGAGTNASIAADKFASNYAKNQADAFDRMSRQVNTQHTSDTGLATLSANAGVKAAEQQAMNQRKVLEGMNTASNTAEAGAYNTNVARTNAAREMAKVEQERIIKEAELRFGAEGRRLQTLAALYKSLATYDIESKVKTQADVERLLANMQKAADDITTHRAAAEQQFLLTDVGKQYEDARKRVMATYGNKEKHEAALKAFEPLQKLRNQSITEYVQFNVGQLKVQIQLLKQLDKRLGNAAGAQLEAQNPDDFSDVIEVVGS